MIARIYAVVSRHAYEQFCLRCRAEARSVDETLAALVEWYTHGGEMEQKPKKAHAQGSGVDYRAERSKP